MWSCSALASIPPSFRIAPLASETRDHLGAELLHDPRRPRADVAEALDDEAGVGRAQAQVRRRLAEHVDAAATRGSLAPVGALEGDWLAGADRRRVAVQLAVLVHHPGHHLGVGVDVRRRDVPGWPEHLLHLVHERASDLLELRALELIGGAVDTTLGAPEGNPGHRGLPGHQRSQRADLVDIDLGVEADAALVGAPGAVVLDAIARVDVDLAVGELHRDLHGDLAVRRPEHDPQVVGELQAVGGDLEVVADDVEVRDLGPLPRLRLAGGLRLRLGLLDRLRRLVDLLSLAYRGLGLRFCHPNLRNLLLTGASSHKRGRGQRSKRLGGGAGGHPASARPRPRIDRLGP